MHLGGGLQQSSGEVEAGMVSLMAEVPEPLLQAMRAFIECHPNWDQYRLFQAALAGFLVQHSAADRAITRCYLANLFPGSGGFQGIDGQAENRSQPASRRQPQWVHEAPDNLNRSVAA
jgi:hypothetical protein